MVMEGMAVGMAEAEMKVSGPRTTWKISLQPKSKACTTDSTHESIWSDVDSTPPLLLHAARFPCLSTSIFRCCIAHASCRLRMSLGFLVPCERHHLSLEQVCQTATRMACLHPLLLFDTLTHGVYPHASSLFSLFSLFSLLSMQDQTRSGFGRLATLPSGTLCCEIR